MTKPNPKKWEEFLAEHLPYEIAMMRASYSLLEFVKGPNILSNALIESFCVHARNLIEFFKHKDSCDFDPRHLAVGGYKLKTRFVGDSVLPKITNQISHLTVNRTAEASDKITGADRRQIYECIESEIARLHFHLKPEFAAKWKVPSRENNEAPTISVSGLTTATNSIMTVDTE